MKLFAIAFSLFLLMDPIGNIPYYLSLLKGIDPKKQRKIILRENIIALIVIIFFYFIGEALLKFLDISQDTVMIAGGFILFLLALKMVFPPPKNDHDELTEVTEPFIVPLAIPLVAGPAVLAAVILYSHQEGMLLMMGAIALAWAVSLFILTLSSILSKNLGQRGIIACERLMGLILILIAIEMFLKGVYIFIHTP
jgi:multiple antibiotic resistance protein